MSVGLAIALVAMTSAGVALLLLPLLLRRGGSASREAYNLAVYRDQLAEVDRDVARGLLNPEQAEAARTEIGRRILALGPGDGALFGNPKSIAAATVAILLVPVAALLIYARLGSPMLGDRPAAAAAAANADHIDMQQALAQLRDHLKQHPDDLTGWLLLARSETGLGHYREGVEAYRRAADLSGHRPAILADWGEAQVLEAGGTVTPAARRAFEAALKDPEAAPRARYYLALGKLQQGDAAGALQGWRALAADSPSDAPWLPTVRQRIAEAEAKLAAPGQPATAAGSGETGKMPPPAAVGAAAQATAGASPAERQAMIDAMVARLAARLEQQPGDADGWARLGHSYMVLDKPAKARDAFTRALKLKPDDAALKEALAEASAAADKKPDRGPK